MPNNQVTIELELDDSGIRAGLKKTQSIVRSRSLKIGKQLATSIVGGLKRALTGITTQLLAIGGLFVAAFGTRKAIQAAARQEDAINQLNSALTATGKLTEETSKSIQDFASEIQKNSRFGDEFILENAALIQSLGDLDEEGLKKATQASVDLAAALKIDLRTAAQLVGRAAAGEVGTFSRYGLVIEKGATNAETFANTLEKLSKFTGSAARDVDTFSGVTEQLSNSFGDLLEEIGFIITESPVLVDIFKVINRLINDFSSNIKGLRTDRKIFLETQESIKGVAISLTSVVGAFEIVTRVVSSAFGIIKNIIKGITTALELIGVLAENIGLIDRTSSLDSGESGITSTPIADRLRAELQQIKILGPLIEEETESVGVGAGVKVGEGVAKGIKSQKSSIANIINTGIVNVVSSGLQAIGASLVKGASAFENFGNAILGILGDLAIQIGTILIAQGLAIDALKTSLLSLNGAQAIAAGAALIALGGALKAVAGGSGPTVAAGGGTSVQGSGGTDILTGDTISDALDDSERGQVVNVTIQGNVLDRRQTGLEIVEVLQEAIGTNRARIQGLNA